MRIAHVSEAFGGGVQTAIVNYITATPEHDHHLLIRSRPGHGTIGIPENVGVSGYSGSILGYLRHARRQVVDGDFDIVHLHSSFAGVLRAVLPARIDIAYSPHCYATETGSRPALRLAYHAAEKALSLRPQILVAVSPRERQIGYALNPRMPATIVPNCATAAAPETAPEKAQERTDLRPTVAMTGRICAQKDPRFFAEVANILHNNGFRFIWIGEGDDGADGLRAAGVEITGWLTPAESRGILRHADLYLHTAAWEGGPLAPLEAAAAGCPVLSRTIGSMSSLGYRVVGNTPAQAATAVNEFFSSDDFRKQAENSTAAVLRYHSLANMSEALKEAYRMTIRG
ncbi:glycosyltransferase [Gordonia amarae]|uniref:Glycosyltransferase n=2 Tax=Gordonia amarae TaxID=36821 RepID=A0A857LK17_9ACTN|nr:glycosyltransferase family 4 protein [Gordonia amarae]MCS3877594.1 glycosyltransferase involved in cell wall biosynthesis [Gordonia amarae]QHN16311.1 glycosyltransferase [Gordonia amarae]QHN20880.1 glycosyltransferase [Gordonia amarae]QHN29731.1 glycosyltransferase [Gordonia amarae]QHN38506.1 glycosyltransferase [Gordonia amarae]